MLFPFWPLTRKDDISFLYAVGKLREVTGWVKDTERKKRGEEFKIAEIPYGIRCFPSGFH